MFTRVPLHFYKRDRRLITNALWDFLASAIFLCSVSSPCLGTAQKFLATHVSNLGLRPQHDPARPSFHVHGPADLFILTRTVRLSKIKRSLWAQSRGNLCCGSRAAHCDATTTTRELSFVHCRWRDSPASNEATLRWMRPYLGGRDASASQTAETAAALTGRQPQPRRGVAKCAAFVFSLSFL